MITVYKDGTIRFPNLETVANTKLPDYYEMDKNDPLVYRLTWCPCRHRIDKKGECPKSKRLTILPWCSKFDKLISPVTCSSCPADDKVI